MIKTSPAHHLPGESKILKGSPKGPSSRNNLQPNHLLGCWEKVGRRIRHASRIVVFLDFDGTLVRLRRQPNDVFLGAPVRGVLRRLVKHPKVTLCFISGRQLGDLQRRAQVDGAIYFGVHGWERSNGKPPILPGTRKLRKSMDWVRQQIADVPGIRLEDKGACFAVHYRAARKPAVEKARAIVKEALAKLGPGFKLMSGKKIWEVYPADMGNKGLAAKDLLKQIPGRKLVIYAGDDTTDETAFALLRNGVTIRVGRFRETKANFFVRGPAEVLMSLKKLEGTLT